MAKQKAEYLYHSGNDLAVVNAAKVSFDRSDAEWISDELAALLQAAGEDVRSHPRLIRYLAKHDHWTPFAHNSISLRMAAPVPIRTQCFKHKQGFVENEESRRYIDSRPELFIPDEFRNAPTNGAKQGSAGKHHASGAWRTVYRDRCESMIDLYTSMIDDGVCPEQARFVLPQGCIVNWIWTGNLYSYANFYNKRTDAHAQKEIQDLAKIVGDIVGPLFPVSWKELTS